MRLIDADALREIMYHRAFEEDSDMKRWYSGCWIRYRMFEQAIEETQTTDAEPVVRCRYCIYSEDTGDYQDTYFCHNQSHNAQVLVHSREYCSHGKKMKGADDED